MSKMGNYRIETMETEGANTMDSNHTITITHHKGWFQYVDRCNDCGAIVTGSTQDLEESFARAAAAAFRHQTRSHMAKVLAADPFTGI